MPGRNRTGPIGMGAMTGRGLGICTGVYGAKYAAGLGLGLGLGLGFRRGFERYFAVDESDSKTRKELLQEHKELLESRLNFIEKQIESL